jgi:hypothetical protein
LESEGCYNQGKTDGLWKFWHANGQLESKGVYKDDNNEGIWREWHVNGQLCSEGDYKDGKKEGIWREWHVNGQFKSERTYRDGIEVTPEPECLDRKTSSECLIYKEVPTPGTKYLLCEFSEEHVMDYNFMEGFKKTANLTEIKCMYCNHPVKPEVYKQI